LKTNQYSDDDQRMKDMLTSRPGFLDAVDEVKSWWSSPASIGNTTGEAPGVSSYLLPQPAAADTARPLSVTTKLELDGRQIAEAVNTYNGGSAVRGTQGGY
ncbi:MAG: phage tail tape measure protein, partial [Plesiomonas sp.]